MHEIGQRWAKDVSEINEVIKSVVSQEIYEQVGEIMTDVEWAVCSNVFNMVKRDEI